MNGVMDGRIVGPNRSGPWSRFLPEFDLVWYVESDHNPYYEPAQVKVFGQAAHGMNSLITLTAFP